MSLKPNEIAAFEPSLASYKVSDEKGLFLLVHPSGGKYWRFRYRWAGKQNTLSCGIYPNVGLEQARARRDEFRLLLVSGVNPGEHAKRERAQVRDEQGRQLAETRFMVDSKGALTVRLGKRVISLTPTETAELRDFLTATREVAKEG